MTPRPPSPPDPAGTPVQLPLFDAASAGARLSQRLKAWLASPQEPPPADPAGAPGSSWPDSFFDAAP